MMSLLVLTSGASSAPAAPAAGNVAPSAFVGRIPVALPASPAMVIDAGGLKPPHTNDTVSRIENGVIHIGPAREPVLEFAEIISVNVVGLPGRDGWVLRVPKLEGTMIEFIVSAPGDVIADEGDFLSATFGPDTSAFFNVNIYNVERVAITNLDMGSTLVIESITQI